jgi:DNA-binding NarL/FixJ family response regulator
MEMDPRPVSVLVVDDHRLMREGTAALLRADERVEVAGLARDGREALALAERRAPDVVLLDSTCPSCRASRPARRCASAIPTSRC